jgi:hypothetical protein
MIQFSLGEVSVDVPETHTVALRGGQEFPLDRRRYAPEGNVKILVYGEGRYVRDGAQSFAEIGIAEGEVAAWGKIAKRIPKGFTVVQEKGKAPCLHATSTGVATLLTLEIEKLPSGNTPASFRDEVERILDAHALRHAEERAEALYSGVIPEGKAGGAQPELSILRGYVISILAKQRGINKTAAAKIALPPTVGGLAAWFTDESGVNAPEKFGDAGAWFDALRERAEALVKQEREARDELLG